MLDQSKPIQILIVEDDFSLCQLLVKTFARIGYATCEATTGEEALTVLSQNEVDLILLDVMMPGMSGFEVCQEIRKRSAVPIIMLTALNDIDSTVQGFQLGADDYIAKPFVFRELMARVEAILRRTRRQPSPASPPVLASNGISLSLNKDTYDVNVQGKTVHLTNLEYELLKYLMERAGKPVNKETLLKAIWNYPDDSNTNIVEVCMLRLRNKIEQDPQNPSHLITIRSVGYMYSIAEPSH